MKKKCFFVSLLMFSLTYNIKTKAQDISLVKDINTNFSAVNPASQPSYLKLIGDNLFFSASTTNVGYELWVYNRITKEVKLVKDLYNGPEDSFPSFPTEYKGLLYFSAEYDANLGVDFNKNALWKTDGTKEGTVIVKKFDSQFVRKLIVFDNNIFFTAYDDESQAEELWKSDGTEAGTVLVKDIFPGNGTSFPSNFIIVNNELFFTANDGTHGTELWKTNGTEVGTLLVKDIRNGIASSSPNKLIEFNNELYFSANNGVNGFELWKSNGTPAGTFMVRDINLDEEDSDPSDLVVFNGNLYFQADDGIHGAELWKTNGTTIGTTLVKDIYTGNTSGIPSDLTVFSGNLFFGAQNETHGFELWKSDGTTNGTQLVKDIALNDINSSPRFFTIVNGNLFFTANDGTNGTEVWKSDGTSNGTTLIKDINNGSSFNQPLYLTSGTNNLYFIADDGTSGYEVWKSDGTEDGTQPITNLKLSNDSSSPTNLTTLFGNLYFTANNGTHGIELWKSNGTSIGTSLMKDIKIGVGNSSPNNLIEMDGSLFFTADDGVNGIELWKSNGTENGTELFKDISNGISSSFPSYLTTVNENLFFTADNGINGTELWKSDGTIDGTSLVKDIKNGISGSFPDNLFEFSENLYFTVNDGINGTELWKSDGTENGTELLKDIRGGSSSSFPRNFTKTQNNLFFTAKDGTNGRELWKTNGTSEGTELVKDIYSGTNDSSPDNLTVIEGILYFTAEDGINGTELWKSNGTENGTTLVKDIRVGGNSSFPSNITQVSNSFYFIATDETNGRELWKSNGTTNGTYLVKDINPGTISSNPSNLLELNRSLYFTATTPNGLFLFRSDGTSLGTTPVGFLNSVTTLKKYNNEIYIVSYTDEYGEELYKYDPKNNTFFKTGNWSDASNWSKGTVPTNTSNAIIKANEIATIDINEVAVKNLTVKKFAKLNITSDKDISIIDSLYNFGNISISSNNLNSGVLFLNNPTQGNGTVTYERGGLNVNYPSIISAPVKNQKIIDFAKNSINNISINNAANPIEYGIATYNDENNQENKWEYINADTEMSSTFNIGVGYLMSRNINGSVFFNGIPLANSQNVTVRENEFNAIGNPFTTYFYANKNENSSFISNNLSKLQVPAVYVRDNEQGKYVAYTNLASSETKILPPGQGFIVKTKLGETLLNFDTNNRSLKQNSENETFNKSSNNKFYLKLHAENGTVKVTTDIIFDPQATSGLDNNLDIENFTSESFDLFSKINNDNGNYTIQSLANQNYEGLEIPLGIITNQRTNVTFSVETFDFPNGVSVFLEDKELNTITNLSDGNYTIDLLASDNNRFYLSTSNNALNTTKSAITKTKTYPNPIEDKLNIKLPTTLEKVQVTILDILGKKVFEKEYKNETKLNISFPYPKGIYFARITANNKTTTVIKLVKK